MGFLLHATPGSRKYVTLLGVLQEIAESAAIATALFDTKSVELLTKIEDRCFAVTKHIVIPHHAERDVFRQCA